MYSLGKSCSEINAIRAEKGLPPSSNASFFEMEETVLTGVNFTWNKSDTATRIFVYTKIAQEDKFELEGDHEFRLTTGTLGFETALPYYAPMQMCQQCCKEGGGQEDSTGAIIPSDVYPTNVLKTVALNKEVSCKKTTTMIDWKCCVCDFEPTAASAAGSRTKRKR